MFRSQNSSKGGNNHRGLFLRGSRHQTAAGTKSRSTPGSVSRKPQLSPLKENSPSRTTQQFTGDGGGASRKLSFGGRGGSAGGLERSYRDTTGGTTSSDQYYDNSAIGEMYGVDAGFSRAEIYELQESFKLFDVANNGNIRVGDLRTILEQIRQEQRDSIGTSSLAYSNPRLDMLLNQLLDLPDDETLTMESYIDLMATTMTIHQDDNDNDGTEEKSQFASVFRLFDTEDKGFITVEDLERVAIDLGEYDMTRGELEEMIARARSLQDGRVGLNEFTRMMTMPLFHRGSGGDGQES